MHDQQPAPGGQPVRPEGNRPANNARLSTPGAMGAGSVPAGDGAADFLGLGDELGALAGPSSEPAFQPGPAPAPQAQVWEEHDQGGYDEEPLAEVVSLEEEEGPLEEVWQEYSEGLPEEPFEEDEEPPPGVLAAWKEDEPVRRGRSKLIAICVGVGIVGMMGVAGVKLVSASRQVGDDLPEPLAAHSNPLLNADRVQAPDTPAQGAIDPSRFILDANGNVTPTETRSAFEPPPLDPADQARAAFEAARGDAPPVGFDPDLDTPPASAGSIPDPTYEGSPMGLEHGSPTGKAELAPRSVESPGEVAAAGIEAATGPEEDDVLAAAAQEPAVESIAAPPPVEEAAALVAQTPVQVVQPEAAVAAAQEPPPVEPALELVPPAPAPAAAGEPAVAAAEQPAPVAPTLELAPLEPAQPAPTETAVAVAQQPARVELVEGRPQVSDPLPDPAPAQPAGLSSWLQIALQRGAPPPAGAAAQDAPPPAPVQPAAAPSAASREVVAAVAGPGEPGATRPADQSPVETLLARREPRPSAVVATDTPPAPGPSGNLRQATQKDLATVWDASEVPARETYDLPSRLLTPNVGRVRVLLTSKDVFEGRLYAVGEGNVWLESEHGRVALQGARVASVERLTSREGTPTLGEAGSQGLAGMERVRVKTPGGQFYGKVISRDEKTTTLVTDDGARLTLDSKLVELLVDAPKVTIKGTAPEKELAGGKRKP